MRSIPRGKTLVEFLLALMITVAAIAQVSTTQVTDVIYRADGTTATGTVLVSWDTFTTASGQAIAAGTVSVTIAAGGRVTLALAPNVGADPMGSFYTAVYHLDDGRVLKEFWAVPVSTVPVALSAIRSAVLPSSVAMQTVSKNYVDTAIVAAVTGHVLVTSPYLQKSGDAMTGPLVLAADPASTMQAADKHYVDVSVANLSGGLGQKVSTLASATQTVVQPGGTQLQVNKLNGVLYASQYVSGRGGNGVVNALATSDCAGGCEINVEPNDGVESYSPTSIPSQTLVVDDRGGERRQTSLNPMNQLGSGVSVAQSIESASTLTSQQAGSELPTAIGLEVRQWGLTGGSNVFAPAASSTVPYFKTTYSAMDVGGTYNTPGQHVLVPEQTNCYGVGDCLLGSRKIVASGGIRDNADEGAHPYDIQIHEDTAVFTGRCATGCTTGSTQVMVAATSAAGTQGEGRYLIDTNPAKVLSGGVLIGGANGSPHASANFGGSNFPLSVFFQTAQSVSSQANDIAPGTLSVAIASGGVPAGYQTNTAAAGTSGVACMTDQAAGYEPQNYEMANFVVVDGAHLLLTMNKPHSARATVAIGGLCGYGLEQTVDTQSGIRQVFPVIGSYSSTGLYYMASYTPIVGVQGSTSGFMNVTLQIQSVVRAGNVVTVTTPGHLPYDVNGLAMAVSGVADSTYNGTFTVTTTSGNTLTYAEAGPDSASVGGTVALLTGGYALYPMAEVLGVYDGATGSVDGLMRLAPNTVAWAASDSVEQPHYFQEKVSADIEFIGQTTPRPADYQEAGIWYDGNNGPGLHGWSIQNNAAMNQYLGYGGTHSVPDVAYESAGLWKRSMVLQAGEQAAFSVNCNGHGCNNWNSAYNLFELSSSGGADVIQFQPNSSTLSMAMRGSMFYFSPQGFSTKTISADTIYTKTMTSTSGTIDGTVIGGSSPAAAVFSNVLVSQASPVDSGLTVSNTANGPASDSYIRVGPSLAITTGFYTLDSNRTASGIVQPLSTYIGAAYGLTNGMVFNTEANAPIRFGVNSTPQLTLTSTSAIFGGSIVAANFRGVASGTTGSIGGYGLAAGACASGTVGVQGVAIGLPVIVAASDGSLPSGLVMIRGAVTATNVVTVQVCAVAGVTPAAATYNVRVIQ